MEEVSLRVRMSAKDAHYGGGLVDGAKMLALFGDVATEILVRDVGDEGLFVAYNDISFTAPVHAGDFLEVTGRTTKKGNTSYTMEFEAKKYIAPRPDVSDSAADVLEEPVVVCKATGTCLVPKDRRR